MALYEQLMGKERRRRGWVRKEEVKVAGSTAVAILKKIILTACRFAVSSQYVPPYRGTIALIRATPPVTSISVYEFFGEATLVTHHSFPQPEHR